MSDHHPDTVAAHAPIPEAPAERPLGLPVYRSSTFAFDSSQDYADTLSLRRPGYTYSRIDNPTVDAFAAGVAALEGEEVTGQAFASGMAAISTVLLSFLSAGDHVVAPAASYGGTFGLFVNVLPRFGIATTLVDYNDADAVAAAMTDRTKVVWAETLCNPTMAVADLPALSALAHRHGALLVVDSTFASPVICRPLDHGADVVVHSATKYIGGHSDVTGGVTVSRPELTAQIRALRCELGGSMSPDDAFLLHRGLATLGLRVRHQSESAAWLAAELEGHAGLAAVEHPSLSSHRHHALAEELFDDGLFGAVICLTPVGDRKAGMDFCDRLRLITIATSLGGAHTLAGHCASTTHRQYDDAALLAAGIGPASVRLSVGLEDRRDLLADIRQALA